MRKVRISEIFDSELKILTMCLRTIASNLLKRKDKDAQKVVLWLLVELQ